MLWASKVYTQNKDKIDFMCARKKILYGEYKIIEEVINFLREEANVEVIRLGDDLSNNSSLKKLSTEKIVDWYSFLIDVNYQYLVTPKDGMYFSNLPSIIDDDLCRRKSSMLAIWGTSSITKLDVKNFVYDLMLTNMPSLSNCNICYNRNRLRSKAGNNVYLGSEKYMLNNCFNNTDFNTVILKPNSLCTKSDEYLGMRSAKASKYSFNHCTIDTLIIDDANLCNNFNFENCFVNTRVRQVSSHGINLDHLINRFKVQGDCVCLN